MKKLIITLVLASAFTAVNAQEDKKMDLEQDYNKWSVELAGGFNKPQNHITPGYAFKLISPYTIDLGVRYMFNPKFGLKVDAGYNNLTEKNNTPEIDSRFYRASLQGVVNLGRVMSFETWTDRLGLLAHGGAGVGMVRKGDLKDYVGSAMAGITGQIRLSNHFAFTADFTTILSARQDYNFDAVAPASANGGFNSIFFNGTAGITYYIGKNEKHADWTVLKDKNILGLEGRVSELEIMNNDTDKDGVVDYLDLEPNTIAGVMVDTKGRAIDLNKNGIPDEIEKYIENNYKSTGSGSAVNDEAIKRLVNEGYVSIFFDFNKSQPTSDSTKDVAYVLNYLRNNPSASVDITGHADELGSASYNNNLSTARANSVKEILMKAGIASSRLNTMAGGEDTSVDKNSDYARKLVRRVTFTIK